MGQTRYAGCPSVFQFIRLRLTGMWAMNELELPGNDSPRPDLTKMPSMDEMLALYEKVMSELDSAISIQKDFAFGDAQSNSRPESDEST